MSEVDVTPRSRRAILAAALGGVAASVAAALGRPATADAANGGPVLLGSAQNTATSATQITSSGGTGFVAIGPNQGLHGQGSTMGSQGISTAAGGIGVVGTSIYETSGSGKGVVGISRGPDGAGISGLSQANATGVIGMSIPPATASPNPNIDRTGVYGYAVQDATSRGVFGESTVGSGVVGLASSGPGVRGSSFSGTGVRGEATTGIGVSATAPIGGTALAVSGRATFSRSGRAVVPANKRYVDVVVPGVVAPTTLVVATLETYATDVWVQIARKNYPSVGTFRIYLNKIASTTSSVVIGWVAIN